MSFNTSVHIQFPLNLTLNVVFKVRGLREITGHSGSAQFLHILNQHTFAYVLNPLHHVHSFIETLYLHREKLKKQNDVHSSIREASRNWPSLDELQTRKLVWVKAFFNFILMIIYTLFQTVNSCACVFFASGFCLIEIVPFVKHEHATQKFEGAFNRSRKLRFGKISSLVIHYLLLNSHWVTLEFAWFCLFFLICVMNFAQLCQALVEKTISNLIFF